MKVFISHSSNNKTFAERLCEDLRTAGHTPWLDKDEIKVGDSILSKVAEGIETCDVLALVLTNDAIASGWVDKEWKAKFLHEINTRKPMVLPLLLEDCDMPTFLADKLYADFRKDYSQGLASLLRSIA